VGVEGEGGVISQGCDEVQLDQHAGASAPRASARRFERVTLERVVEVLLRDVEAQGAAADRCPSLELVDGDAHALGGQRAQRLLDPLALYHGPQVGEAAASRAQEGEVGTAGVSKHPLASELEESLFPPRQAFADTRQRRRRIDVLASKAPISPGESPSGVEIAREPRKTRGHGLHQYPRNPADGTLVACWGPGASNAGDR